MECVGVGGKPCPNKAQADAVNENADGLALCQDCQATRKPKICSGEMSVNGGENGTVVNPMLSYVVFALQSGTVGNIKNAVLGHFTPDQITEAKSILWETCGTDALGEQVNRRDGPTRSGAEANVTDILNAMTILDKKDKMPRVLLDAHNLGLIPRSHPEELNNISLVDRLNQLEYKYQSMQTLVDSQISDDLKERVMNLENTVKRTTPAYATVLRNS